MKFNFKPFAAICAFLAFGGTATAADLEPIPAPPIAPGVMLPGAESSGITWYIHYHRIETQKPQQIGSCTDCVVLPIPTRATYGERVQRRRLVGCKNELSTGKCYVSKQIAFKLFAFDAYLKHEGLQGRVTESVPLTRDHRAWQHPVGLTVDWGLSWRHRSDENVARVTQIKSGVGLTPVYETSTDNEANRLLKKYPEVFTLKRRGRSGNLLPLEGYVRGSHWSTYNDPSVSSLEIAQALSGSN